EFYERDALAVRAGSEHYMDVVVVTVETVDGLVGVGESLSYGGPETVASAVEKMLGPLIIGSESFGIRALWEKMYKATYRLGRRGIVVSAMSGIDTALWDILGKEVGAPVYKLLGAAKRPVKGYITGGYYRDDKDVKKLVEEEKSYVEAGFDTVKIKIGGLSFNQDLERVRAVREELGPEVGIACDANNVYDFNTALKMGRELEKLGIIFFEEPILTDYPDLSRNLARSLDIPIAGYETAYTQFECRDLIANEAVDIVQADASWNGGITELLNIGALANAYGLPLIPHYSAGGIGFVASLHSAAAIGSPMIEYHLRPNPLRKKLSGDAIKYESGMFQLPDKPGLGVSIQPEVFEEFERVHATSSQ
ncbi:MAG TPA: mandelate racemase/muconate lactonizing enzyme family protein, partial [Candidatus Binatus sp.]|nr:mandelate racemase/muconate lactonizing enzyme family protein [Candidatus Binatus sp.]